MTPAVEEAARVQRHLPTPPTRRSTAETAALSLRKENPSRKEGKSKPEEEKSKLFLPRNETFQRLTGEPSEKPKNAIRVAVLRRPRQQARPAGEA
jgi:hypothetical protein